jgi:hypothetical protein
MTEQKMEELQNFMDEAEVISVQQGVPMLTGIIMAQDRSNWQLANDELSKGRPFHEASIYLGSFARFDWIAEKYLAGEITVEELTLHIAEEWRGSDPDDSDYRFLMLWEDCYNNKGSLITDEDKTLPEGEFTIYRGQLTDDPVGGLSWSLSEKVARKFATGAALRTLTDGFLLQTTIDSSDVTAYITERNEEELIIDPHIIVQEDVTYTPVYARTK